MLFNSYEFLLLFLPISLFAIYVIQEFNNRRVNLAAMLALSALFYCYSSVQFFVVLVLSIAVNYALSIFVLLSPVILALGVTFNLGLLGAFKYAPFLAEQINRFGAQTPILRLGLPLAISFYTFKQISYLVDAYRGKIKRPQFMQYAAYVTFFPHLIAGPIVRYSEVAGRLDRTNAFQVTISGLRLGLIFVAFGLAKKVGLADRFAVNANAGFSNVDGLSFLDSWVALVAFALQIYFDFSGYSDVAIGLALMFGIRLPDNFNSPYKATSIADFWHRWHISLSRFLRDYLYIPLGGNRHGERRTIVNLFVVMALGGLWHGANWTFVVWGVLHGFYLAVHRLWATYSPIRLPGFLAWFVTFIAVLVAWVFFRAQSFGEAWSFLGRLVALDDLVLPARLQPILAEVPFLSDVKFGTLTTGSPVDFLFIAVGLVLVWTMPTTKQIVVASRGRLRWAALAGLLIGIVTILLLETPNVFVYFNF